MAAHSQFGIRGGLLHCIVERRAIGHKRRAAENPFAMSANDCLVHAARHSEVIRVKNQIFHWGPGYFAAAHPLIASTRKDMRAPSLGAERENFFFGPQSAVDFQNRMRGTHGGIFETIPWCN
jgi:hypothetical protein